MPAGCCFWTVISLKLDLRPHVGMLRNHITSRWLLQHMHSVRLSCLGLRVKYKVFEFFVGLEYNA